MEYILDIEECQVSKSLINYLKSLSYIKEVNRVADAEFEIPEHIKTEIRAQHALTLDSDSHKTEWNTLKKSLYENLQHIR
jgi:hypothetical protein